MVLNDQQRRRVAVAVVFVAVMWLREQSDTDSLAARKLRRLLAARGVETTEIDIGALTDALAVTPRPVVYTPHVRFDMDDAYSRNPRLFVSTYRFTPSEIRTISSALPLPEMIVTKNRLRAEKTEVLLMLLHKLAYPTRLVTMEPIYNRDASAISRLTGILALMLYLSFRNSLFFNMDFLVDRAPRLASAYYAAGNRYYSRVIGMLDGTLQLTNKPTIAEERLYNGMKDHHGLKFQTVVGADGLFLSVFGPYVGRPHDITMLADSGLEERLEVLNERLDLDNIVVEGEPGPPGAEAGKPFVLYADGAYVSLSYIYNPTRSAHGRERAVNYYLSQLREPVEWGNMIHRLLFKDLNFSPDTGVCKTHIGANVMISFFLTNVFSCLRGGNQMSDFIAEQTGLHMTHMGLALPSGKDYIAMTARALTDGEMKACML